MNITFFNFNKNENSTKVPTATGTSFTCFIKSPSSIINPIIELKDNPINFNYCYIPDFSRYYFINDIVFNKGTWICYCNIDVLGTYRTVIGNSDVYALRSAYESNGELVDTLFPVTADTQASTLTALGSGSTDLTFSGFNSGYYVLGVQGYDQASQNGVIYYQLTPAQFTTLLHNFYANSGSSWWGNLERGVINALNKISDYIVSCRWYPTTFTVDNNSGNGYQIYLGSYATSVYAARVLGVTTLLQYFSSVPVHPQADRGNFIKTSPFSRYVLVHPLTGPIELNSRLLKASNFDFTIYITPDYTSGQAKFEIRYKFGSGSGYKTDLVTYVNYGTQISLSGNDVNVGGLINSAVGTGVALLTGDALGVTAGIASTLNNVPVSPGHNQSNGGFVSYGNPILNCMFKIIADRDVTNKGLPLCKVRKPVNIPGYILPDNPQLNIGGTDEEKRRINSLLASGFFYE